MKKDLIITYFSEAITLVAGIGVYKLSAYLFLEESFALYALFRRVISFVQPVLLVGLAVGLPRFISLSDIKKSHSADTYVVAGLLILVASFFLFAILSLVFKQNISIFFFGSSVYQDLWIPLLVYVFGILSHSFCYSFFRGKLRMTDANILQIVNLGVVPLVSFLANSIEMVILINGVMLSVISCIVLFFSLIHLRANFSQVPTCSKQLLIYGIQRVPGDISLAVLFLIPATIATHLYGVAEGGYVAFSITMMSMLTTFFSPISILILPHAGKLLSSGKYDMLKFYTKKILKWSVFLSLIIVIVLGIFTEEVIRVYLGNTYTEGIVPSLRIVLTGGVFLVIFVTMRGIIDAYYQRGINAVNQIAALLSFFLLVATNHFILKVGFTFTLFSLVASISLLGILTFIEIVKIFRKLNIKVNTTVN